MARVGTDGLARLCRCDWVVHQAAEDIALAAVCAAHECGATDDDLVLQGVRQGNMNGACCRLMLVEDQVGIVTAEAEIADRGAAGAA